MQDFDAALAVYGALGIEWRNTRDVCDEGAGEEVVYILVCLLEGEVDGEGGEAREVWVEFVEEVEFVFCAAYGVSLGIWLALLFC